MKAGLCRVISIAVSRTECKNYQTQCDMGKPDLVNDRLRFAIEFAWKDMLRKLKFRGVDFKTTMDSLVKDDGLSEKDAKEMLLTDRGGGGVAIALRGLAIYSPVIRRKS